MNSAGKVITCECFKVSGSNLLMLKMFLSNVGIFELKVLLAGISCALCVKVIFLML